MEKDACTLNLLSEFLVAVEKAGRSEAGLPWASLSWSQGVGKPAHAQSGAQLCGPQIQTSSLEIRMMLRESVLVNEGQKPDTREEPSPAAGGCTTQTRAGKNWVGEQWSSHRCPGDRQTALGSSVSTRRGELCLPSNHLGACCEPHP